MIEVIVPGLYSSIQDLGRVGYRKYGVPVSGAMDHYSAKLANQILENRADVPILEVTLIGPTLRFKEACEIAISGAEFEPDLNSYVVQNNTIISIEKGSILKFGPVKRGMRAYLAITGGFESEIVLGSASYYPSFTEKSRLQKGDELLYKKDSTKNEVVSTDVKTTHSVIIQQQIEVMKGPEFHKLSEEMQKVLVSQEFTITSESNRMGTRLMIDETLTAKEIITSPVQPGTVQLTPSGQLIILGRDAQTTGGYARVLQLTEMAQNCLAQVQIGSTVRFTTEI